MKAFPSEFWVKNQTDRGETTLLQQESGMDLRDYFAAKALQGLLANPKLQPHILKMGGAHSGWIEESAYGFANAMMEARNEST